ncbi:hypothetical protein DFJ74DRAFT_481787 [Hyaloraphidium curvatum]|nr:hypothetical protein DFJ74DRAFT_481787 [Hyaloraphidium curvatum]
MPRPRIAIAGGSFAGLHAARQLAAHADVSLVDPAGFAEYVPAVPRVLAHGGAEGLQVPLSELQGVVFVRGAAKGVEEEGDRGVLLVDTMDGATRRLPFDFLIIATGAEYRPPVHSSDPASGQHGRAAELDSARDKLAGAAEVLLVGGGPVGVELAAELASIGKQVVLACGSGVLAGMHPGIGAGAKRWLEGNGVRVLPGATASEEDGEVVLSDGQRFPAAATVWCTGSRPRTAWCADSPAFAGALDPRGYLRVLPTMQLDIPPDVPLVGRIFAAGDCAKCPAVPLPGLAHTAEKHAAVAASNALRLASGRSLGELRPDTAVIYSVSLGPRAGLLEFAGIPLLTGAWLGAVALVLGAVTKRMVEVLKVAQMRGYLVGEVFWAVADPAADLLARVVLGAQRLLRMLGRSERTKEEDAPLLRGRMGPVAH